MTATTVEQQRVEVCRLKEKGDRSCMTTWLTAVAPPDYNRNMTSNTKLSKDRGLALECRHLQTSLQGSKLFDRTLIINLNKTQISTSCKTQLREKLKSFQARTSMFRKELILQVSSEITITWWWEILKRAPVTDQGLVEAKARHRTP
jgi:hypothetical protein